MFGRKKTTTKNDIHVDIYRGEDFCEDIGELSNDIVYFMHTRKDDLSTYGHIGISLFAIIIYIIVANRTVTSRNLTIATQ